MHWVTRVGMLLTPDDTNRRVMHRRTRHRSSADKLSYQSAMEMLMLVGGVELLH